MPKPKRADGLDVLADLFAFVPWWLPFVIAAAVWLAAPIIGPRIAGGPAWEPTWRTVGVVAAILIALAGVQAQFVKHHRERLVQEARSLETLQALTWREFEELCAEAYRRQGFAVSETARGADGGVDLVLRRGSGRIFVQCKHYAVRRVDVRPVRELFGVMAAEGATGGIFICSGTYTSAATDFAKGNRLELVDGTDLLRLLSPVTSVR